MLGAAASRVIRLHVSAGGDVFVGDDTVFGDNTQLDAYAFAQEYRSYLRTSHVIRILGTAENARLITLLYDILGKDAGRVHIGSPGLVPAAWSPLRVLQWLWQIPCTGRLYADWHTMTSRDYAMYAVIAATRANAAQAQELIQYHPAWPALSLFGPASLPAACHLVHDIIDPRWYTHKSRPGRLNKLYARLGLTPANFAAYLDGGLKQHRYGSAVNALNVWYTKGCPLMSMFAELSERHASPDRLLLAVTKKVVHIIVVTWQYAIGAVAHEAVFDPVKLVGNATDGDRLLRLFSA